MKSRRELLLLTAGTAGLAGCSGDEGRATPTDTETPNDTATPTPTETATEEPTETTTEQPENQEWRDDVRSGVPLNGLGAYTDQVLEAGPVRETKAREIKRLLEQSNNLDEEIDALTEILTNEEFDSYMAEYHRQKNDTENQVVVNKNWSFTSQSEPILELYKVTDGNLQSQPTILDHDPNYNSRNINKPGSEEPQYLAALRDSTNGARSVPEDYDALQDLISFYKEHEDYPEKMIKDARATTFDKMSSSIFGVDPEENFIFYDGESANLVANGKFEDSKEGIEAFVDLSNSLPEAEGYGEDVWTSAEYTETGWEFRTHPNWQLGQKLPSEQ